MKNRNIKASLSKRFKQSDRGTRHDARHLFGIQAILNKPVIMGLLL
ncbi:MAG: hypothetical protein WC340_18370 [Kiritimatiellia bacterium]